jgi:lipopolysaccharide/colanic/teichoic acid biosynthesis glycosyltransferase
MNPARRWAERTPWLRPLRDIALAYRDWLEAGGTPALQRRQWGPLARVAKRTFDFLVALGLLLVFSPLMFLAALLIWLEDRHSPVYSASRIGKDGEPFRMYKLRTMVPGADRTGVDSTAEGDPRITRVGRVVRKLKLDEFLQFANVVRGDMSLLGPRPQVHREVRIYTKEELRLLSVRPGLTDFASVVFADLSEILNQVDDPDIGYNQLIRPWKNRMALHYLEARSLWLDMRIVLATNLNVLWRGGALRWVASMLDETGADPRLVRVAERSRPLEAAPPPGADSIVTSRDPVWDLEGDRTP